MTRRRTRMLMAVAAATIAVAGPSLASPPAARAFNPIKSVCTIAGLFNGVAQKACSVVGKVTGGAASTATTALTVAAVVTWAVGGAKFLLHETSHVLAKTTAPQLTSTWFSSTYWRVAGIAAVLTLPFLFAAAIQALLRSDLSLLIRAALGYLPLAMLAVAIAAPLTMLLLAASDQLSAIVSSAAGNQSVHFLDRAAGLMGSASVLSSSFVGFLVALLTAAGAIVLWMELLVREAAVYVIVLMLPLAFAAFVWPARRIWAIRSIELLVALILSKFAIVAVLSLGGAAVAQSADRSITGLLAGAALIALATFAPWAMLRVVPMTEIASGAAASLRSGANTAFHGLQRSDAWIAEGEHWASKTAQMRRTAEAANGASSAEGPNGANPTSSADGPNGANPSTSANGASAEDGATAAKDGVEGNAGAGRLDVAADGDVKPGDRSGRVSDRPIPASDSREPAGSSTESVTRIEGAPVDPRPVPASPPGPTPVLDCERPGTRDVEDKSLFGHDDAVPHHSLAADNERSAEAGHTVDLVDSTPPPQPNAEA